MRLKYCYAMLRLLAHVKVGFLVVVHNPLPIRRVRLLQRHVDTPTSVCFIHDSHILEHCLPNPIIRTGSDCGQKLLLYARKCFRPFGSGIFELHFTS